ncbi:MAG: very short patch repair endonuclease, partial [Deltaproteobacteria bacterium]|nr:very short patch repair endonuclease [Deltaproteobacteria bacterium]
VHGCFWHQHPGCKNASIPQTRVEFWKEKFKKNVENFKKQKAKLEIDAWKVLVVWECEIKKREQLLLLSELIIRKNL